MFIAALGNQYMIYEVSNYNPNNLSGVFILVPSIGFLSSSHLNCLFQTFFELLQIQEYNRRSRSRIIHPINNPTHRSGSTIDLRSLVDVALWTVAELDTPPPDTEFSGLKVPVFNSLIKTHKVKMTQGPSDARSPRLYVPYFSGWIL